MGPPAYPPVYPALLAPVYRIFNLNLTAFKRENILFFLAALYLLFLLFKDDLPPAYNLGILASYGVSPVFWDFKETLYSDVAFLALCLMTLLLMRRWRPPASGGGKSWLMRGTFLGCAIYLCYGTRLAGCILLPVLWILDYSNYRRITHFSVAAAVSCALLMAAQEFWIPQAIYWKMVTDEIPRSMGGQAHSIYLNCVIYWSLLAAFWHHRIDAAWAAAIQSVITVFAIYGFIRRVRAQLGPCEIFTFLYGALLLLHTFAEGVRWMFPIAPFYLFYACLGLLSLKRLGVRGQGLIAGILFAILMLITLNEYYWKSTQDKFGAIPIGLAKAETAQLFDYIREKTDRDDVFIFRRARFLPLFTGRAAAGYSTKLSDQATWDYLKRVGATHLIVSPVFTDDREFLAPFVSRHGTRLLEIFSNGDFRLYRVLLLSRTQTPQSAVPINKVQLAPGMEKESLLGHMQRRLFSPTQGAGVG